MQLQFPLKLALNRKPAFDNYFNEGNRLAVNAMQGLTQGEAPGFLYLWGETGTGKSHLLMALCESQAGDSFYLPLGEFDSLSPEILKGLEQFRLVCIDDIDSICGEQNWEESLFHLYNRIRENNGFLVVTASSAPRGVNIGLEDLKSRLMWGAVYQLQPLGDEEKAALLMQLAAERGMLLQTDAAAYLIKRCARDTGYLVESIENLDRYSLARQRKLTIPLLSEWLQYNQTF
jgi:DnaA family protein